MNSAIYHGEVFHRRLRPAEHSLSYKVFWLLLDLDEIDELAARLRWFSRGRFNLHSFHDRDHGAGRPDDIAAYLREMLAAHGLPADGPIRMLTFPRMLGYVFNPITVFYCHDRAGSLRAVLYQVSSTFGERHSYLIPVEADDAVIRQSANKRLHVSPFMGMDMRYDFRLSLPRRRLRLLIRQIDAEGTILTASFNGVRQEISDAALLAAFRRYPLMTLKVIAGIHWEAVKLFGKGLRLVKGPPAPAEPVTLVRAGRSLSIDGAA